MIHKLDNWPVAFAAALSHAENKPFIWGENDCCLFACNCIFATTGIDLARTFRGYTTASEAAALIAGYGGLYQLVSAVCRKHDIPEILPRQARRGDPVLFEGGEGPTLGICTGDKIAAPGRSRLATCGILKGINAWRIE
ncbi:MAG: hypothetical protein DI626_00230 [Micavibrio aeruginosavorus]|uniref:DUF6950 domain-containing protein n=1 Tax=Micavibrio aeruginosavorus TaxID=349221 RepID=A0A2W5A733_9BACT|nr:MAG: hypothetical protein DI626_00230 [Micavibrio aeruginosavorus]